MMSSPVYSLYENGSIQKFRLIGLKAEGSWISELVNVLTSQHMGSQNYGCS